MDAPPTIFYERGSFVSISMVFPLSSGGAWSRSTAKSFAVQTFKGSWFLIFASFLIMSVCGIPYLFGLYSGTIKSALGYDQTTLNTLSFFKDIGTTVGVVAGLLNEIASPWTVVAMGAVLNFYGYFMIWLSVTDKRPTKVWLMCFYICVGANSTTFTNTGVLVTCVKSFPERRGVVIGILKGYTGLSAAIVTQFYHAIYGNPTTSFLLFLGWLPAAVSFVFLPTVRVMKFSHQPDELKVFYNFLYISLGLAGFIMLMIIVQQKFSFNHSEYSGSAAMVVFLLLLPFAVVLYEEYKLWKKKMMAENDPWPLQVVTQEAKSPENSHESNGFLIRPSLESQQPAQKWWQNPFNPPKRGDDFTILQALFSFDMLLLFLTTACGIGGTLTAIDNLGQIGASLEYPEKSISTFVSLVSIWNYLGRVFAGFSSEMLLVKYKFPRPLMLPFVLILSCVSHLLIAFNPPGGLYIASILIGFCYGAQWALLFSIVSEVFGLRYYATLYNFGSVASPVGLYLLNVLVTGHLYDKEALKQLSAKNLTRTKGEELVCNGIDCFKLSFLIITAVTLFGTLVSLVLVSRTKNFYKSDIYKKFREEEMKVSESSMAAAGSNSAVQLQRYGLTESR